jgi:uncharacterized protein (TIGR01244 family)
MALSIARPAARRAEDAGLIGARRITMALTFTWLTPEFATAGQLSADDIAQAAAAGFRSVITNRPDLECSPAQPTSQAMQQAAGAAGLDYAFLPVQSAYQTPDEISRMHELLRSMPKPVLGFCRSGTRTANLFRAASAL